MGGLPQAGFALLMGVAVGAWILVIMAFLLFAAVLVSGVKTRWMRSTRQAEPWAQNVGGACIILSALGYTLALAYAVLFVAMLIAVFLIMGVFLRAMLDKTLDRR